jgi:2-phosphoglycerate kinase
MQKIQVIDEREGSQVPFLRGILTRSLQRVGVPFDDAYAIASDIRDQLSEKRTTISSTDLRTYVHKYLQKKGFEKEAEAYRERSETVSTVHVVERDGAAVPFSKGRLSQSMEICGFDTETAYQITKSIESGLFAQPRREFSSEEIAERTHQAILRRAGETSAERYDNWRRFSRQGRPIILLVGGTTGVGKSTISSELAHRLDIVRTQSTDMLREVMRLMIPPRLLPALHTSSFGAYKTLPHYNVGGDETEAPTMVSGYLSQAEQVGVGVEGVLRRAENEQVSLIIEGVHVHPAMQQQTAENSEALVVPLIIAVLRKKRLRKRLIGRGQQISSRRSERYLENFDHIWDLQSFLLDEADRFDVPIIENSDEEEAVRAIMHTISDRIAGEMKAVPPETG